MSATRRLKHDVIPSDGNVVGVYWEDDPAHALLEIDLGRAKEICAIVNGYSEPLPDWEELGDHNFENDMAYATGAYIIPFWYCGRLFWMVDSFDYDTYIDGDSRHVEPFGYSIDELIPPEEDV